MYAAAIWGQFPNDAPGQATSVTIFKECESARGQFLFNGYTFGAPERSQYWAAFHLRENHGTALDAWASSHSEQPATKGASS